MKTALLLIDIQNDYFENGKMTLVGADKASENAKLLLEKFRLENNSIIHVQHIATHDGASFFIPNTSGAEIHTNVTPKQGEKHIVKHAPNAFKNTDLQDYLNDNQITNLVICGSMTHMCIDASVRAAADFGFNNIVIGDACATKDLSYNGETVKAKDAQIAFLAALNGTFAEIKTTIDYLQ
ncbi:MAG: cysteine hydrolase family protein [Bacteroidota bacterium]